MDIFGKDARSMDVGKRLRELREERNVSMRELARRSGLSANALSMIERNLTSPSVSTLQKVSKAMGVPITAFFRADVEMKKVVFCKAASRIRVPFQRGVWQGLNSETYVGRMEAFAITLETGGASGPHGMTHSGDEFVICLRGTLDYEVDRQTYRLEAGDTLIFSADLPHRWKNSEQTVCDAMVVISDYQDGESPTEYHRVVSPAGSSHDHE
jgi:transcriptional regulator with XRE-family HTH domain